MKVYLIPILILAFVANSKAQQVLYNSDWSNNSCAWGEQVANQCVSFWNTSHGQPKFYSDGISRVMEMRTKQCQPNGLYSNNGKRSDGVFYDHGHPVFRRGEKYTLTFSVRSIGKIDRFYIKLANTLKNFKSTQSNFCGDERVPPGVDNMEIKTYHDINHGSYQTYSISFTPTLDYKHLWFYPENISNNDIRTIYLKDVKVEKECYQSLQYQNTDDMPKLTSTIDFLEAGRLVNTNEMAGDVIVNPNKNVVFKSEKKVVLKPGFKARENSFFLAKVQDCDYQTVDDVLYLADIQSRIDGCIYRLSVPEFGAWTYNWSHGLGNSFTATANPQITTTYSCEITTASGEKRVLNITLTPMANGEPEYTLYNAVSPNGDGVNDRLDLDDNSNSITPVFNTNKVRLSIFTRQEQMVFEKEWTGVDITIDNVIWEAKNMQGEFVVNGQYLYVITFYSCNDTYRDEGYVFVQSSPNSGKKDSVFLVDDKEWIVYPTLSTGKVTVHNNGDSAGDYIVYGVNGDVVEKFQLDQDKIESIFIDNPGMYFIKRIANNGVEIQKVIIQ